MTKEEDDPILRALRALPVGETDPAAGDRVRRAARAAFDREHEARRPAWRSDAVHLWSRVGVPALLASAAFVYVYWAVSAASALYR